MEKRIIENEQEAFKVPEGYFEGFEERLMTRIKAEEQVQAEEEQAGKPVAKANTRQLWINRGAVAVGIAGLIFIGISSIIKIQDEIGEKAEKIVMAQSDENDEYYDAINEELSSEEIEEALAQIEFDEEYEDNY